MLNRFIFTWIIHQIFMFSNKVNLVADSPIPLFTPNPPLLLDERPINDREITNKIDDNFLPVIISTYILHPFLSFCALLLKDAVTNYWSFLENFLGCPLGWSLYGYNCYLVQDELWTWSDAEKQCG